MPASIEIFGLYYKIAISLLIISAISGGQSPHEAGVSPNEASGMLFAEIATGIAALAILIALRHLVMKRANRISRNIIIAWCAFGIARVSMGILSREFSAGFSNLAWIASLAFQVISIRELLRPDAREWFSLGVPHED
jgi:hypothetical protein